MYGLHKLPYHFNFHFMPPNRMIGAYEFVLSVSLLGSLLFTLTFAVTFE